MHSSITIERPDPLIQPEKPSPTIWAALGWVAGFLLLQVACSMLFILPSVDLSQNLDAVVRQMQDPKIIALPSIRSLVVANSFVILLFALYVRKGDRAVQLGLTHWGNAGVRATIRTTALLISGALIVNGGYTLLIGSKLEMQKVLRDILAAIPPTGLNIATILFATVILAPVVEELVFRGMLQKSLTRRLPTWAAIAVSAVVFSAMHGDINSAPALAVVGAIFGTLYHLTGSLRLTIAAHLANNLFAMLASNFF